MLYLLFQIGKDRYAIEARQAVEVLPFVDLERIPPALSTPSVPTQRPRGVAGIFNYRGQPMVAVDLCDLILGRPARELLSTRIIVVKLSLAPRLQRPESSVQSRGDEIQDSGLGPRPRE
jgi:chemotaxis-related protein WspB